MSVKTREEFLATKTKLQAARINKKMAEEIRWVYQNKGLKETTRWGMVETLMSDSENPVELVAIPDGRVCARAEEKAYDILRSGLISGKRLTMKLKSAFGDAYDVPLFRQMLKSRDSFLKKSERPECPQFADVARQIGDEVGKSKMLYYAKYDDGTCMDLLKMEYDYAKFLKG